MNAGKTNVLAGASLALLMRITGAICVFCLYVVVSKSLPLKETGAFFFAFSVFMLLGAMFQFGNAEYILRESAVSFSRADASHGKTLTFLSILFIGSTGFIVSFSGVVMAVLQNGLVVDTISPAILSLYLESSPAVAIVAVVGAFFQSRGRPGVSSFLVGAVIPASLLIAIVLSKPVTLEQISLLVPLVSWFSAFVSIAMAFISDGRIKFSLSALLKMNMHSGSLWASLVAIQALVWAPTIILGYVASPSEVALFSVSTRITMVFNLILAALNSALTLRFAASYSENHVSGARETVVIGLRGIWALGCVLALIILICRESLLMLFGVEFAEALPFLNILLASQLVSLFFGPVGLLLILTGQQGEYLISVFSALVTLALVCIVFGDYGVFSVAFAVLGASLIQNISASLLLRSRLGWTPCVAALGFRSG